MQRPELRASARSPSRGRYGTKLGEGEGGRCAHSLGACSRAVGECDLGRSRGLLPAGIGARAHGRVPGGDRRLHDGAQLLPDARAGRARRRLLRLPCSDHGAHGRVAACGRDLPGGVAGESAPMLARIVATGELGYVYALRGEPRRGRGLLAKALAFARQNGPFGLEIETTHALARVESSRRGTTKRRADARAPRTVADAGGGALLGLGVPLGGDALRPPRRRGERGRVRGCACPDRRGDGRRGGCGRARTRPRRARIAQRGRGRRRAAVRPGARALRHTPAPYDRAETQVRAAVAFAAVGSR